MLISVYLLPDWWTRMSLKSKVQSPKSKVSGPSLVVGSQERGSPATENGQRTLQHATRDTRNATRITRPSSFYQLGLWRLGLAVVSILPAWLVKACCVATAGLYFWLQRSRREVVVQNLLPAVSGNRPLAEKTARRLYRNFALKLADLWQVENGVPVHNWVTRQEEQEVIRRAWARGRGVLFITLHLGNWEHGGLLLADMGIKLTVLSRPEPEDGLTELRTASRARWGIGTLIVGRDQFAFVEVIKRLQDGDALAISIDRPPERNSALVELFGQPFRASVAAAELARASGCALIGVTIVRRREGYAVRVLPEFVYERQALGSQEARRELTGQILRAFEPEIRDHLDQWYHFVPIWPATLRHSGCAGGA